MIEIQAPISVGELIDKMTILEIKSEKISDSAKLKNVRIEQAALQQIFKKNLKDLDLEEKMAELKDVNLQLWEVEDLLRDQERRKNFGSQFVQLARSVYTLNDRRASIKKTINTISGSKLVEEKSYKEY